MRITLTLNDRLYDDIEKMIKAMGVSIDDYLVKVIEDKFYTDKYGDLNELFHNGKTPCHKECQSVLKVNDMQKKGLCRNKDEKMESIDEKSIAVIEDGSPKDDKADEKAKKRISRTRTIKSR